VSYGSNDEEKPRKAFLRGGLFLGNEYEKSVHIDKEDLKEVSVSYGSNVKLSNLFPTGYAHQKYILTSGGNIRTSGCSCYVYCVYMLYTCIFEIIKWAI
jgi:hypothetical protein